MEIVMLPTSRPGNGVCLSLPRSLNEPSSITRRAFTARLSLTGFATLFAGVPLIGEAMAQNLVGGLAAEPVSLPDMALGPKNAPVVVVDYSSMTCSHCAAFMTQVFPMVRSKYIDTGRVRFVFREFPLDIKAASASMLARTIAHGDSSRYFSAIDILFRQQDQLIAQPTYALKQVGNQFGMSQQAVETCLKDQALLDQIAVDQKIAAEVVKVKATPSFFINGRLNEGFMSFEAMDSRITSLLIR
jgi:protein-disulfide isomerase